MNYKQQFTKYLKLAGIYEQDQYSKSSVFKEPLNIWLDIIHAQWLKLSKLRGVKTLQIPTFIANSIFDKQLKFISNNFKTEVYSVDKGYILKPTSEMILYNSSAIKRLINSYLNLPQKFLLKNRVYRKQTRTYPLVRHNEIFHFVQTHEFYKDLADCDQQLLKIVRDYTKLAYNFGLNTLQLTRFEDDRFSGSINSIALDIFIPAVNKRLQIASVHNLSNNFSSILNLQYKNKENVLVDCFNLSHGYSERFLGGIILANLNLVTNTLYLPHILRLKQIILLDLQLTPEISDLLDFDCVHVINKAQYKKTLQTCLLRDSFVLIYGASELKNKEVLIFNRLIKKYVLFTQIVTFISTIQEKTNEITIQKLDNLNNIIDNTPYTFDMKFYNDLKSLNLKSKIWGYADNLIYFGPTF